MRKSPTSKMPRCITSPRILCAVSSILCTMCEASTLPALGHPDEKTVKRETHQHLAVADASGRVPPTGRRDHLVAVIDCHLGPHGIVGIVEVEVMDIVHQCCQHTRDSVRRLSHLRCSSAILASCPKSSFRPHTSAEAQTRARRTWRIISLTTSAKHNGLAAHHHQRMAAPAEEKEG